MVESSPQRQVSVLFVCLGNICRSTMAEGVFRHVTRFEQEDADQRIANVDSCGTGAYHVGQEPDDRTMSVLQEHGIEYDHAARKFRTEDLTAFDYIFAMDRENLRHLEQARSRFVHKGSVPEDKVGKVMLWGEYGGKGKEEVIDPYYGGRNGFAVAYDQMVRFSRGFLKDLDAGKA